MHVDPRIFLSRLADVPVERGESQKRLMATRISSADFAQRNGFGSALVASI
jgi:hypothetical protein